MVLLKEYIVAMGNLYGIVTPELVAKVYSEQNDETVSDTEVVRCFQENEENIGRLFILMHKGNIVNETIIEFDEYENMMSVKRGKPHYIPPMEELLRYANPYYFEKNREYIKLYDYVLENLVGGNEIKAAAICEDMQGLAQENAETSTIFNVLNERDIIFDNDNQIYKILPLIIDMTNNVRLWRNNGYTPKEAGALSNRPDLRLIKGDGTVPPKPGRNDPCPCGSGKKYKYCCLNKKM